MAEVQPAELERVSSAPGAWVRPVGKVDPRQRTVSADNLKVVLVGGVVVAHVTMAWAGLEGAWVFSEPAVREPVLTVLRLVTIVGALVGMPLFLLVAGMHPDVVAPQGTAPVCRRAHRAAAGPQPAVRAGADPAHRVRQP